MSPTELYKIFTSLFPDMKIKSYKLNKLEKASIVLTDEYDRQYVFRYIWDDRWSLKTIKLFNDERKE